jgi:UV DNA damage endonuclease
VKVLGQLGLKSNDSRRWQSGPHLRVSIEYLHAIFTYLEKAKIRMYRMSSDVAPYLAHPDLPQFHGQIAESRLELGELGRRANGVATGRLRNCCKGFQRLRLHRRAILGERDR